MPTITKLPVHLASRLAAFSLMLAVTACDRETTPAGQSMSEPLAPAVELAIANHANATPSLAAHGETVIAVWGATSSSGSDIYTAASRDGGRTFAPPVRVNRVPGDARVNGQQPPRALLVPAATGDPAIVVVWTSTRAKGSVLLQARSDDGGRSYSLSTVVAGSDAEGNRGWQSAVAGADGRVSVVWLDHRDYMSAGHVGHQEVGEKAALASKLYFATLDGAVAPRPIARGVCYCCRTAMTRGADNDVYVAWRHVYPGNFRDMALAVSKDGGRTFSEPQRISEDGWSIDGCPENGPTIAVDRKQNVHVAWATLAPGTLSSLALFYASAPAGEPFAPRRRIETAGTPSHVQMAIDDQDRLTLVWDERSPNGRQIVMSRASAAEATAFTAPQTLSVSGENLYPAVATAAGASIVAWSSGAADASVIRVRRIP